MSATAIETETTLLERARALRPLLSASADQIERERQLPEPVVEALAAAGLFTMLVPRELGGGQVDPETGLRVIEEVSRGDGSAGWCLNVAVVISLAAGSLREETAAEIWGHKSRAFVAGSAAGSGTATVVDGGYRVSGRWAFASGCQHASWLTSVANVLQDGTQRLGPNGVPESRFVFFPRSACQIVDTWRVAGMRGTGSHDFVVEDLFVPEVWTHRRSYGTLPRNAAPLYMLATGRVPAADPALTANSLWVGLSSPGMAAVTLGIARGALDDFVELAAVKVPDRHTTLLRDDPIVHRSFGRAEAKLRSARAFLYETVDDVWRTVLETGTCPSEGQTMIRLTSVHAAETATEVVETVWRLAGTSAIVDGSPLDRRLRDVKVGGQNVTISPLHISAAGQVLLGSGR